MQVFSIGIQAVESLQCVVIEYRDGGTLEGLTR